MLTASHGGSYALTVASLATVPVSPTSPLVSDVVVPRACRFKRPAVNEKGAIHRFTMRYKPLCIHTTRLGDIEVAVYWKFPRGPIASGLDEALSSLRLPLAGMCRLRCQRLS
jgi:hypothetical protein